MNQSDHREALEHDDDWQQELARQIMPRERFDERSVINGRIAREHFPRRSPRQDDPAIDPRIGGDG